LCIPFLVEKLLEGAGEFHLAVAGGFLMIFFQELPEHALQSLLEISPLTTNPK
jgi:hypothetical protein